MKYRKKPVLVDAIQYLKGENFDQVKSFVLPRDLTPVGKDRWAIQALEGDMKFKNGDYIIRGVAGECYPCKPDIFAATYEPAEEATP